MQSISMSGSCPSVSVCDAWSCPPHPYTMMLPGEANSPSSWSTSLWAGHSTDFWRNCNLNGQLSNGRRGHGRISCSSTGSSSSYEDMSCDDIDDNNNSSSGGDQLVGGLTGSAATIICGQDANNNDGNTINNNNNEEDISYNNTGSTKGKGWTKSVTPRTRVVDEDGYIRRAACVCLDETETKVLLVSSKKDPGLWLVPGGGVEDGEDTSTAAVREAWEEAGVRGHITRYLGLFETQHHTGRKRHRTAVFVVTVKQVLPQYPESHLGEC
ncbi:uncharacterized protein LOC121875968 isoform X2 [Homarus americanus]|uniref:uncharacterized protein LOC121875968 isoform X2 n=1 Tax=Homarus americanus TaxID=6706 RepID=UPI001C45E3F0|nr:uncharacterized protein LOC121875968 isoform X2 [Homarus americanus]